VFLWENHIIHEHKENFPNKLLLVVEEGEGVGSLALGPSLLLTINMQV
jgi:hypothetical protein